MKHNHFKIAIPIYEWEVLVSHKERDEVLFKRLHKLGLSREDFESTLALKKGYGVTMEWHEECIIVIRIINYYDRVSLLTTITHETNHAASYILKNAGIKIVMGISDEAHAYLQDYICGIIFKKLGC